jgi:hypothetical protein
MPPRGRRAVCPLLPLTVHSQRPGRCSAVTDSVGQCRIRPSLDRSSTSWPTFALVLRYCSQARRHRPGTGCAASAQARCKAAIAHGWS